MIVCVCKYVSARSAQAPLWVLLFDFGFDVARWGGLPAGTGHGAESYNLARPSLALAVSVCTLVGGVGRHEGMRAPGPCCGAEAAKRRNHLSFFVCTCTLDEIIFRSVCTCTLVMLRLL